MTKKKQEKVAKLAEGEKVPVWVWGGVGQKKVEIPMTDLSDEELQKAYTISQEKELTYFNRTIKFSELKEQLAEEAERRKVTLLSLEEVKDNVGDYFVHEKKLKEAE